MNLMPEAYACPKCGKPMEENPNWKGQWSCPDYKQALNTDGPPFRFKCDGQHLTDHGAALFDEELRRQHAARN